MKRRKLNKNHKVQHKHRALQRRKTTQRTDKEVERHAFKVRDYKDEEAIIADIEGRTEYLNKLIYHFIQKTCECRGKVKFDAKGKCLQCKQPGKSIYGFSWEGAKELAHFRGHIYIEKPEVQLTEAGVIVMVNIRDLYRRLNFWGIAEEQRIRIRKDGSKEPNKFAIAIAGSKAQRNGILHAIPAVVKMQILERWKKERDKVLTITDDDAPQIEREEKQELPEKIQDSRPAKDYIPTKVTEKELIPSASKQGELLGAREQGTTFAEGMKCAQCKRDDLGPRQVEISLQKTGRILCNLHMNEELKKGVGK